MKVSTSSVFRIVFLSLFFMVLVACKKGTADLQVKIDTIVVESQKNSKVEPVPTITDSDPETWKFKPSDKRDPFRLPKDERRGEPKGPRPDMNRPKEELEQYALDSLDMVGTLGTVSDQTGLIKDPTGVVHLVRRGDHMGQNYGRVIEVFKDRIELVELVELNSEGESVWSERPQSIALGDK